LNVIYNSINIYSVIYLNAQHKEFIKKIDKKKKFNWILVFHYIVKIKLYLKFIKY